jgi:hypothetical protein
MAINGTHMLFYTSEAEQLRAVLRDVFGFAHVDAGGGWLIFALPPSEIGVHPAEGQNWESGTRHLISFMCDNINSTIAELQGKGVSVDVPPKDEGYGITTMMHLPGGCDVMLYEPRHAIAAGIKRAPATRARNAARKPARKTVAKKKAAKKKAGPSAARTLRRDKPDRRAKTAGRRR